MIIKENLTTENLIDLRDFLKTVIYISIKNWDFQDEAILEWFIKSNIEEYFTNGLTEIYENNIKIGKGVATFKNNYIYNESTKEYFNIAFEEAKRLAYIEVIWK